MTDGEVQTQRTGTTRLAGPPMPSLAVTRQSAKEQLPRANAMLAFFNGTRVSWRLQRAA